MSSDVIWHIRDKLWPMPKHGSIRMVYACLAVTCHLHFWQNDRDFLRATVVTRGWNGYRNKSQHRKSTLEKKILPPFQQGFEPATFQSRVRRSNHWAIPAPWRMYFWWSLYTYAPERVKARPRAPTRKTEEAENRRQNNGSVKAVSPRHCAATSVLRNCCFNCRVTRTMSVAPLLSNNLKQKKVQLLQPSSTSLLMSSSGLTTGSSTTSLLLISLDDDDELMFNVLRCQLTY